MDATSDLKVYLLFYDRVFNDFFFENIQKREKNIKRERFFEVFLKVYKKMMIFNFAISYDFIGLLLTVCVSHFVSHRSKTINRRKLCEIELNQVKRLPFVDRQ